MQNYALKQNFESVTEKVFGQNKIKKFYSIRSVDLPLLNRARVEFVTVTSKVC